MKSQMNLYLMRCLASSPSDREVVQFLTYGWPLNHDGRQVSQTYCNHRSAAAFPDQVDAYIRKEWKLGCLLGPFITPPWSQLVAISPMSTREKKGSSKRRILMDLSWPRNGKAVNDGIAKDSYLNQPVLVQYPTVDKLCRRAAELQFNCMGYKRDLDRAFKQLLVDYFDWPLQGIFHNQLVFFDKTAIMGSRTGPLMCQKTSSFVRHVMENIGYFLANYVDDFMGIESPVKVHQAYVTLQNLLRDMRIQESLEKAVPPAFIVEFLGVLFNFLEMTISVTPDRMRELMKELSIWKDKLFYSRKELESLLGKLQFVSNCVRPGRVMMLRLRDQLPDSKGRRNQLTSDMIQDIRWWETFMSFYNGTSIMWMEQMTTADALVATDACLTGIGATGPGAYFAARIPERWRNKPDLNIAHYEMLAVIVAMKVWKRQLQGIRFVINCDNQVVVSVIQSGLTRDKCMAQLLRELTFICATGEFELVPRYIRSRDNRLPDLLSRAHLHKRYMNSFLQVKPRDLVEIEIQDCMFDVTNVW